jgi:hypothetical protein
MTDGVTSPDQFRLWTAISLVAGACERRVWARVVKGFATYPNLYVLLTSAPGVGKQPIAFAKQLWRDTVEPGGSKVKAFHVAPSNMTKASLVDNIAKAKQLFLAKSGNIHYHSLLVAAEEFQVLLPTFDPEYIAALNDIFNNPADYAESRRTGAVRELDIENPQLNILAGVQPSYFVSTFPDEAWTTGLARRILMIYSAESPFQEYFQDGLEIHEHPLWRQLLGQLAHIRGMYGAVKWDPRAVEFLSEWHRMKEPPVPVHSKLTQGYNNSRGMFAIKLSIISAVARTGGYVIELVDVRRALLWLFEAETKMPDVFREMVGKSDAAVVDELHYFVGLEQKKSGRALTTDLLWEFLRQRVPSEKIEKILLSTERAGLIYHPADATDLWMARAGRTVRGVE